jgi:hypothetical protein
MWVKHLCLYSSASANPRTKVKGARAYTQYLPSTPPQKSKTYDSITDLVWQTIALSELEV